MKVSEQFTKEEFESLLDEARMEARGDWELNFVSDIEAKYDEFGADMFLSDKQAETLDRIATPKPSRRGGW